MSTELFSPLVLPSGAKLRNRIAKAAMEEGMAGSAQLPDDRLISLYRRWGAGGAGLLITGNVMVHAEALTGPGGVVLDDRAPLDPFMRWAETGRAEGAAIWMQISHPGRQVQAAMPGVVWGPSEVAVELGRHSRRFGRPVAMTEQQISATVERFAATAALAERAGFDGVEVHGAHGYLLSQFLSPLVNKRSDQWGGSLENRARLLLDVVRAVRAGVSPSFAVAVKLNSADFQRGGFSEDESRSVVAALAGEGIDLIEVSGGSYEQPAMMGKAADSTRAREAYFLEYARTVRSLAGDIPLAVTGGFRSRAAMDDAVADGECDVVGLGRPTATTTDAADVILAGRAETLTQHQVRAGMRGVLGRLIDIKSFDGLLELSWHTDQLHRVGAGLEPDLDRGRIATTLAMLRRNGTTSFGRKRGL
jgi:2,4-dienoyl-CoA reductase-like NADH-dependent reductase (Old Yellow Enzyme family)